MSVKFCSKLDSELPFKRKWPGAEGTKCLNLLVNVQRATAQDREECTFSRDPSCRSQRRKPRIAEQVHATPWRRSGSTPGHPRAPFRCPVATWGWSGPGRRQQEGSFINKVKHYKVKESPRLMSGLEKSEASSADAKTHKQQLCHMPIT